LADKLITYQK